MSTRFPSSANAFAERQVLSVSQLNRQARMTIEQRFNQIWVSGELSFCQARFGPLVFHT